MDDKIVSDMIKKYFPKKTFRFSLIFILMKHLCFHHHSTNIAAMYVIQCMYLVPCAFEDSLKFQLIKSFPFLGHYVEMLCKFYHSNSPILPLPPAPGEICFWDFMMCDFKGSSIRLLTRFLLLTAFACFFHLNWYNSVVI